MPNAVAGICILLFAAGCSNEQPSKVKDLSDQKKTVVGDTQKQSPLVRANALLDQGNAANAEKVLQQILLATPDNLDALQTLLRVYGQQSKHRESAETALRMVDLDAPNKSALLTSACYSHLQLGEFDEAERHLVLASKLNPDDFAALQLMVQLYNAQGRRHEACQAAERMASIDFPGMGVAISLIERAGPFQLVDFSPMIPKGQTTLFDLGKARVLDVVASKFEEAYETAKKVAAKYPDHPAVQSYLGRLIAYREVDDASVLTQWLASADSSTQEFPDYWHALGIQHRRSGNDPAAIRAFSEAVRRDPTDRLSLREIVSALTRLEKAEQAQAVQETINVLDNIYRCSDKNALTPEVALGVAEQMTAMYRPWEGLRWRQIASALANEGDKSQEWNMRSEQIREWYAQASSEKIASARMKKMLGFDAREYPLVAASKKPAAHAIETAPSPSLLRLTDVAGELGLKTRFVSGYSLTERDFLLYQANGGGLATFDYDLDGFCDAYVVQSGGDPQDESSTPNELFRNLDATNFEDVSAATATNDDGFGQGVCVGDVNQDGWPDIVVGNLADNRILINQGDGTFRDATTLMNEASPKWTSSVAIGDVNGDALPDIVEANYIDDDNIFTQRCTGGKLNCHPQLFTPAVDRVFLARPDGSFTYDSEFGSMGTLPSHSLGCVLTDIDGDGANDLFVTVDGGLNHYFRSEKNDDGVWGWNEVGVVSGCSVGRNGRQQACMGIAVADFDRNETLDVTITNFEGESCNLFLQSTTGLYRDEADLLGLSIPTEGTLGFGVQAVDFDNDGFVDIARLNGHIYDQREKNIPFKMAPQLFHGSVQRFSVVPNDELGEFWQTESLGRTLANFDYNRDGKVDLLANALDQDVAVLRNDSNAGNWIAIKLVGVKSERNAIGAKVSVDLGNEKIHGWQASGGYMNHDESRVQFGLGNLDRVPAITIHWPSGHKQIIKDVMANQQIIVVEDK